MRLPAGTGGGSGEWHSAGGLKFGSVEVAETRFPLFFERHEYRPNSGGDGQFIGGSGCELLMHLETDSDCVVNTAGEGTRHAGAGREGGYDGATHDYRVVGPDGHERVLKTKEEGVPVRAGSVFDIRSAAAVDGARPTGDRTMAAGTTKAGLPPLTDWRGLMYNIGIDIGGTFTDLVLVGETGAVSFGKTAVQSGRSVSRCDGRTRDDG